MRSFIRIIVLLPLAWVCFPREARPAIARMQLDSTIDSISAEYIVKGIDRAEAEKIDLVLIRLNTPGGFAGSMEEIISRMLNSHVPVVVYVGPSGAKAASAGFFILLAADVAAMAPGTNTGAAHPLMAIGGFPVDGGEAGKTLTQKITSNASAFLRSITSKRNRNAAEAEKGVTESKSFTESEAMGASLIDLVARDEGELLRKLNGFRVRMFSGTDRVMNTAGQSVIDYPMSGRQRFLSVISQPNLALLLGLLGIALLYFEFSHPGFVAPGVIGGISLLLSILGFSFLPVNYVGVLLIVLALGLFVAEVKVQGFGVLGLGGIAAMVIGIVILVDSPDPAVRIGISTALAVVLPFALIFLVLLVALFKSLRQKAATGQEGMIGLVGVADTEVGRSGRVKVRGEYWRARADTPVAAGRPVRVLKVEELTLQVEEVREG